MLAPTGLRVRTHCRSARERFRRRDRIAVPPCERRRSPLGRAGRRVARKGLGEGWVGTDSARERRIRLKTQDAYLLADGVADGAGCCFGPRGPRSVRSVV